MNKWTLVVVALMASAATLYAIYAVGCKAGPDPAVTQQRANEQLAAGDKQLADAAPAVAKLKTSNAPEANVAVKAAADLASANAQLKKDNDALTAALAKANAPAGSPPSAGSVEGQIVTWGGLLPAPWNSVVYVGLGAVALWRKIVATNAGKSVVASIEHAKVASATFATAMADPVVVGVLQASQTADAKALVDAGQRDVIKSVGVMPTAAPLAKVA